MARQGRQHHLLRGGKKVCVQCDSEAGAGAVARGACHCHDTGGLPHLHEGPHLFPSPHPRDPIRQSCPARERISSTVKGIIEERRKADCCKRDDFLNVLLSTDELSDEEKVSFVLDSLLGGYETTSLMISMVVYFLGQSAQDLDLVKREHQGIRSTKAKEECLSSEDYKKMEYTQHVINEALRCGNIVKFVHRKALKDVRYKEYLIPSGWKVLPVFSAVHLNPSLHGNAQQFQPCRWEGPSQGTSKKFTPFGGGTRLCPGSELAKVEAAFFLHHLVLNFRWKIDGDDIPMAYPYVEFPRGLPIEIEPICSES
ncbi:unnamed protein product [Triticum turgidum subsp. durum]|uniref:Cytochrome P450 n=1 Tax=Triticum turgidum subsp. durum TaxID=4567 RepID=A0A9R1R9J6_TRITD|nr:unnamed protein product [Triticum turgidum subsp. durum]